MNKYLLGLLQGNVAIKVRDFKDFAVFKRALKKIGMLDELITTKERNNFNWWKDLAYINQRLGFYYGQALIFDYQQGKGFGFDWNEKKAIEWWGKENIINAYLLED